MENPTVVEHKEEKIAGLQPETSTPINKVRAELSIVLYTDGQVQVNGPLEDRIMYLGLLALAAEIGKDFVQARQRQAHQQKKLGFWDRQKLAFAARKEEKRLRKMREDAIVSATAIETPGTGEVK